MFNDFADIKTIKRKSYVPLAKRMTMKPRLGLLLSSLIQKAPCSVLGVTFPVGFPEHSFSGGAFVRNRAL